MASEIFCIFKRNSKCIFEVGPCDQDCDKAAWKGVNRSHENLLKECLNGENQKIAFSKEVVGYFFSFPNSVSWGHILEI